MLSRRREQELSEIKALTRSLSQRVEQILEQLSRIQEAQDQLMARTQAPAAGGDADGEGASIVDDGTLGARGVAKEARRREASGHGNLAIGTKTRKPRTKGRSGHRAAKQADGSGQEEVPPVESAAISRSDEE